MTKQKGFVIHGKVTSKESNEPLDGLTVEALDKDLFVDERLGTALTDEDGVFVIAYERDDFQEKFLDRKPDIYLRVKSPRGKTLYTSESRVRYEAGRVEAFKIVIRERFVERLKIEKVILSHLGEVTQDVRTVGDRIHYRIYYGGSFRRVGPEISIVDKVDKRLEEITVYHDGVYDELTRTIRWTVPARSWKKRAYVEFEAVVNSGGVIANQAMASGPGFRQGKSNVVETTVYEKPEMGWLPVFEEEIEGAPPRAYMKDETTMGTTVRFDIAGLFIHEETVDGVAYQHVEIPSKAGLTEVGKPELPVVGEIIEVPFGANFSPEIVKSETVEISGYNVYPAQEPQIDLMHASSTVRRDGINDIHLRPRRDPAVVEPPFVLDEHTYLADTEYPSTPVTISSEDIGIIRGHRVLLLKVNPVQFNPVKRTLTVHKTLEVRLEYDRPAQIIGVEKRLQSPDFEAFFQATLLNYKPQERFMSEGGGGEEHLGCDYLIITHDNFYTKSDPNNPVVRLANWKRRKGYRTMIVEVGAIPGGNTAVSIQTYLQNAYDTWSPPPSYVLLVGDSDLVVPVEGDPGGGVHPIIESDLYYVTVDGSDYFPDMFIGRMSADSTQQVTDMVDKIINYEKTPPATPANDGFYTNLSLVGLFTYMPGDFGREDRPWITNLETIRGFMQDQDYTVERIYASDTGIPGPGVEAPLTFHDDTALPNNLLHPQYGWTGNTIQISNALNAGRLLLAYRAHGNWTGWDDPAFDTGDAGALNQNDLTPLVISITCQTGWFDNETDDDGDGGHLMGSDCFTEIMLRRPRSGAIGLLGMTRNSYTGWNDLLVFGAIKAIWPAFDPNPHWWAGDPLWPLPPIPEGEQTSLRKLGQIANFSKMYMARAYNPSNKRLIAFEMQHLFGEPETTLWTSAPGTLKVDHPQGIGATGQQEFVVNVTDDSNGQAVVNATVVLTRDDEIIQMKQTGSDGVALFSLHGVGSGNLDLTVSALDFRPYLGVIEVTIIGAELNILNPDNGPENQIINVGGRNFIGGENVEISFGQEAPTITASDGGGEFGQGMPTVDLTVPAGYAHGLVNVCARGVNSNRRAVRIFQVRDENPVDLWTYDQRNESTWTVHPGDNPTWNSPDIQLYDTDGNPVASDNLVLGETYTVRAKVRNAEAFAADNASIIFKWENYGAGGPWQDLPPIVNEDIPAGPAGITEVEKIFVPHAVGHLCLQVSIEHLEDNDRTNSTGQENLHVGHSNSPAGACFLVWNPTKKPAPVHFEVRQLFDPEQPYQKLWASWIKHPDPQFIGPGERAEACVVVDPDVADAQAEDKAEFAVTCFIGGAMIGGVNLIIIKQ